MRRLILLVTLAAVMTVATMVLPGVASAQPVPACFSFFGQAGVPPGQAVVTPITTAPGPPSLLAQQIGEVNQNRPCPTDTPP